MNRGWSTRLTAMVRVGIHEAKTHLSKLVKRVEAGEEVEIQRSGTPVARLVPAKRRGVRPESRGIWKGKFWMADDFDSPEVNEQIARDFGMYDDVEE